MSGSKNSYLIKDLLIPGWTLLFDGLHRKCLTDLKVKRHISVGWGMFTVTRSLGESSPIQKTWTFLRSQCVFCCHGFEKIIITTDICKGSWSQLLLGCWNKKDLGPGWGASAGSWGLFLHLGTISISECPWNSLRLAQFFQKGKVKTLLYWDFFQRSSQIILQWCFGEIDFSCVSFSKIALALLGSVLPASKWSIKLEVYMWSH